MKMNILMCRLVSVVPIEVTSAPSLPHLTQDASVY